MNFIKKHVPFFRRSKDKEVPVRKFRSSPNIGRERSIGEKLNNHFISDSVQDLQTIDEISVADSGDSKSVISGANKLDIVDDNYDIESTHLKTADSRDSLASDPSYGSQHDGEAGDGPDPVYFKNCISSQLRDYSRESIQSLGDTDSTSGYGTGSGFKPRRSDTGQTFKESLTDWKEIFSSRTSIHSQNRKREARAVSREDGLDEKETQILNNNPVNSISFNGSCTNVQVNIETGTDDSRMSRSASQPQMVVYERRSQALKSISDRTKCQLSPFEDEKNRVLTSVDKKATEILTRKTGDAVVIILGHEYDGKSFAAKCTQARLTLTWHNAIINLPEEIDEIQIDEDLRTCILKDDLFGKTEFNAMEYERWEPRLDDMLSKVRARKFGFIFTMNKGVFESYVEQHNRHELFNDENILDLTGSNKLSNDDKRGILKCQLQRFPKAKVVFDDNIDNDNVQTFTFDSELCIYEGHLDKILEITCTYGFPKQAEIYASSLENIKLREKFFMQPMRFHSHTISNIRKSKKLCDNQSAFAIETTFLLKGKADIDKVTERCDKLMNARQSQHSRTRIYLGSKSVENTLFDCAYNRTKPGIDAGALYRKGLANLENWILRQNKDNDTVEFSSPVIYNATALQLSTDYEVDVIRLAPWYFIETCIRPEYESNKKAMVLQVYRKPKTTNLKEELNRRFYLEVCKQGNVSAVCGHEMMTRKWFVDGLFEYLVRTWRMTDFVTATDRHSEKSILVHGMNNYVDVTDSGANNLTEDLMKSSRWRENIKNEQLKRKHEKDALLESCRMGKYTTFLCLKKHLDKTCLELAVEAGSIEITRIILREKRFINFSSLSDLLATACQKHCKTNPEIGKGLARLLMNYDCSIDRRDNTHDPLIHDAAEDNNTNLVKLLCELKCSLDIKDKNGNRPLHKCVLFDSTECAKLLIEFGADILKVNSQGVSPLHLAVTQGSIRMVTTLCQGNTHINHPDNAGQTALMVAVQRKRSTDLLEVMIENGADVNCVDKQDHGSLYYAIIKNHTPGITSLVKAGAFIGKGSKDKPSPLQTAIENKNSDVIVCLLESKKESQLEESDILFDLVRYGKLEYINMVLKHGCLLESKNSNGESVLKFAIEAKNFELVNFLCESCPALIHIESNGMMPLHIAIENSTFEICNFLIASGAIVMSKNATGDTPLHIACKNGRMDVIDLLLQLDENLIETSNNNAETPLHTAVEYGQLQMVQILIIYNANSHALTKDPPKKPLDIALAKRNFYNDSAKFVDIEMVKLYDTIACELRKRMRQTAA